MFDYVQSVVGNAVDNRIFSCPEAPQDTPLPYLLFFTTGDNRDYFMGNDNSSVDIDFQVSIFTEKVVEDGDLNAIEIGDLIISGEKDVYVENMSNPLLRYRGGFERVSDDYIQKIIILNLKGF